MLRNSSTLKATARFAILAIVGITMAACVSPEEQMFGAEGLKHADTYGGSKSHPIHAHGKGKIHVKKCGDWTDDSDDTKYNKLRKNHGCAVQSSIAAMIVDPTDINSKGVLSPRNATSDVSSVNRGMQTILVPSSGGGGSGGAP